VTIEIRPTERSQVQGTSTASVKVRDLRPSSRFTVRKYLEMVDIPTLLNTAHSCKEKTSLFQTIINNGLDSIIPLRNKTVKLNEPPWMNTTLKSLIRNRQKALNQKNTTEFKRLRNQINRQRKKCRAKYYENSVHHLKQCKPSAWWKEVKKLSGMNVIGGTSDEIVKALRPGDDPSNSDKRDLANEINNAFLAPMSRYAPLSSEPRQHSIQSAQSDTVITVTSNAVFQKLLKLNPKKAHGPDGIPSWLLKENADLLAGPIADILNSSYQECTLPPVWKKADVVPIPKEKPIQDINRQLRPISLTSILSKLAEEFVVMTYVKPAVMEMIDSKQFGTVPDSCTTYALISMLHTWNKNTDGNGSTTRVMTFDFRKAFDLIDHNILSDKLTKYNIPRTVKLWILDFLTDREQRVKLGQDCHSEWGKIPAGVPQGTKLGPWLFCIMINDLSVKDVNDLWKYVDDSTLSESVCRDGPSNLQKYVDEFNEKSTADGFQINESKCKEIRISFAPSTREFQPITINGKNVELVTSVKLLGLTISDNLKWNSHISYICKKVAPRLYFLRQLKRAKLPANDLILFYSTCIRPVIEYACQAFHDSLPKYLSDELERLQKRAFRIIFPDQHYKEALRNTNTPSLYDRRQELTTKLFKDIVNNPEHKLTNLLPPLNNDNTHFLRKNRKFNVPLYKTYRFRNSFITYNSNKFFE
jgi:hypothetical protein